MKNIFLELKHYTTTDWDFACGECICHSLKRMAKPVAKASLCQKRFGFFHSKPK